MKALQQSSSGHLQSSKLSFLTKLLKLFRRKSTIFVIQKPRYEPHIAITLYFSSNLTESL